MPELRKRLRKRPPVSKLLRVPFCPVRAPRVTLSGCCEPGSEPPIGPRASFSAGWMLLVTFPGGGSRGDKAQEKGRGFCPGPQHFLRKDSLYKIALILRSICSIRVSRFLFRFSYSRTFRSSSAERPS